MRRSTRSIKFRMWWSVIAACLVAVAGVAAPTTASAAPASGGHGGQVAQTPYLGWSSWSLQATRYPGLNPNGRYSWLTEANVLTQIDAMATKLKKYGYSYINIDAGWWMDWDWNQQYDAYGRQTPDAVRFPHGIKYVADYAHRKGLKLGIYLPVGLEKGAYDNGDFPIYNAPGCSTHDIVYDDLRTTNGWDSSYKIDFSDPCAQKYIDSQIAMFADWGIEFLKLDGVGPGSGRTGENYDNTADVAAYHKAIATYQRSMILELSWSLGHDNIDAWQEYADGWRIGWDVECYCPTLTGWNEIKRTFTTVLPWIDAAGPASGWNDLDSLNVGVGSMDGLTEDERRTAATLWAIESSPMYSGDDLTQLDEFGLSLLTNKEVLAINQQGTPARPVSTESEQQVWYTANADGSYTVALFNLSDSAATVTANWADIGVANDAKVRDVWAKQNLGKHVGAFSADLAPHASILLRVEPK